MYRRAAHLLIVLALLLGAGLPMVRAARLQQARVRRLKVCVAIIPTLGEPVPSAPPLNPYAGGAADPDAVIAARSPDPYPFVWLVADQSKHLKPDGWEFYNPAAPAFVTLAQSIRWSFAAPAPTQGTPLKPDMAPYWEVTLSQANYERLLQMDCIYIPIARNAAGAVVPTFFTEEQRRILTRLADAGVTIWVDWALRAATAGGALGGNELPATPLTRTKNAFFTNVDFQDAVGNAVPPAVGHPLLDSVSRLSSAEAVKVGSLYAASATDPSVNRAVETRASDVQMTANFSAVVPSTAGAPTNSAYVAAARYGSGYVVATAGNCGAAIAGMIPIGSALAGSPDMGLAEAEDLKLLYNIFGWRNDVTAQQKNARHTGETGVQINGMLEQSTYPSLLRPPLAGGTWQPYPTPAMTLDNLEGNPIQPLILNGIVVSINRYMNSGGALVNELNAFEASPNDDFDGNGYVDDPVTTATPGSSPFADFSLGLPYDRVLSLGPDTLPSPLPKMLGMAVGEIPDLASAQGAKSWVFVAGLRGGSNTTGLFSVPAPRPGLPPADYWAPGTVQTAPLPNNVQIDYTGAPAFATLPGLGNTVQSRLYAGGIHANPQFGSQFNGKLAAYNVGTGGVMQPEWYYPPNQESNRLGFVSGPVVTAQVMDQATGAIDTMVITTSCSSNDPSGQQAGQNAGDTTGKVDGFIVATRGDVLGFPRGNNAPGAGNPQAGRTFVSVRWLDIPPGTGQPPQARDLIWDITKHHEIRVMNKLTGYVAARFLPGQLNLLQNGTAGQVELPAPVGALAIFAKPGAPGVWDLDNFVLLADYSPLPQPVDAVGTSTGYTIRPRFSPATPYVRDPTGGVQNQAQPTGIAGGVTVGKDGLVYFGTGIGYMCASEWYRGRARFRWKLRSLEYVDGTGRVTNAAETDPYDRTEYYKDFAFVAPPAAGERVVFAAGRPTQPGTVYILEPDATIRFKLLLGPADPPLTAITAQQVMLEADHGIGFTPQSPFILGNQQQPYGRVAGQFTVDPDTGTVTFLNMENISLDLNQALSPQQLAGMGVESGGKPAVPINWRFQSDPGGTVRVAYIPLPVVAIYRPLGGERFRSGPVLSGSRTYVMAASGNLFEIPLDPKTLDPSFPRGAPGLTGFNAGDPSYGGTVGLARRRLVADYGNVNAVGVPPAVLAPPAISEGIVAINTGRGLTLYHSPNVLVADSNRVVEASGDSVALASTDVVLKDRRDDSEFAIPTDVQFASTGGRPLLRERKQLNRLAKVLKLSRGSTLTGLFNSTAPLLPDDPVTGIAGIKETAEFADESWLAADTGNNRCVEFNAAGKLIWELDAFQDPFGYLPAGESLKLAGPMDVSRWIEPETASVYDSNTGGFVNATVYVVHTLIADTGNTRVLEIVDKIYYRRGQFTPDSYAVIQNQVGADGQPLRWYHVLVWSSQTNAQGLRLRYRTAQRIFWSDANGSPIPVPAAAGVPARPLATPFPPYLPREENLSYTMCAVSGQTVAYPGPVGAYALANYNRFWSTPNQAVVDRKPQVRAGGDCIVFLRGRWKVDESSLVPVPVTSTMAGPRTDVREARPGASAASDGYRFAQGVVDPNVPIISEIWDELQNGAPLPPAMGGPVTPVHRLSGVSSVQRTIRADVKFAPEGWGDFVPPRFQYFLIADTDGVWEFRMLPGAATPAPYAPNMERPQCRLTWAFTVEDYAYATGAGNGDPLLLYSNLPANHMPGGRRFSPASAKRFPNGLVLIANRTPANDQPLPDPTDTRPFKHLDAGADVFLLRSIDYRTANDRNALGMPVRYNRVLVQTHGWRPDLWVQQSFAAVPFGPTGLRGSPSVRWRAADLLNPGGRPSLRTQTDTGLNPYELTGTYVPLQPNFADLVF